MIQEQLLVQVQVKILNMIIKKNDELKREVKLKLQEQMERLQEEIIEEFLIELQIQQQLALIPQIKDENEE